MCALNASASRLRNLLLIVCIAGAAASPAISQDGAALAAQPAQKFAFEVISITPNKSASQNSMSRNSPDGGLVLSNAPLSWLVRTAFNIIIDDQISGLPGWVNSDHYDVQAKLDEETAAAWKRLTGEEKNRQRRLMIQALLEERCRLKFHRETKQLPVYELVIAKGGLKMKEAQAGGGSRFMSGRDQFSAQWAGIDSLVFSLSNDVGRVVIDKTGLGGKKFDFTLKWTPEEQQGEADAGPSIYAALEEQLGLKLVATRGPVETVVVDSMERPSPN